MNDYDIVAVGGGSAGLVTAAGAAGLGARVALIERHRLGGECLWTGCVPSKALLAAARAADAVRRSGRFGIDAGEPRVDIQRVMAHVRAAQHTIEPHDSPERFRALGVDVIEGRAQFTDDRRLQVGERTVNARHVVIATGSRPAVPPIPGLADVSYHTNETIFDLEQLPASLVVLGGGAVGVELAQAFALLGTEVTIVEADARILRTEDAEIADALAATLTASGVTLITDARVTRVEAGLRVHTKDRVISAESMLVAAGRRANTDTLNLAAAGVEHDQSGLVLDKYLRTTADNIWGAGDVTGAPRFTHVADYQAQLVLRNALFPGKSAADYRLVPWAIYTHPELAHIGLTEEQARAEHGDKVQVYRKSFGALDRAIADGENHGMLKIVADRRGRIVGGHVLGHHASSILAEITLAMKHDIGLGKLAGVMHAYPTYPESFKQAANDYRRSQFRGLAKRAAGWLVRH